MKLIVWGLFLLLSLQVTAQNHFTLTDGCLQAWDEMWSLRINTSNELLLTEIEKDPDNLFPLYLQQYADLIEVMIDATEDKYEKAADNYDKRIDIFDELGDEDPLYRNLQAEMRILFSVIQIRFKDYISGMRKGYRAYKLIRDNLEEYPEFIPSYKLAGIFNLGVSNMPSFLRSAVRIFGVKGDAEKGLQQVMQYYEYGKDKVGYSTEAAVFVVLVYKISKEPDKAYEFLKVQDPQVLDKLLPSYLLANTAHRSGHNEEALQVLEVMPIEQADIPFKPYEYLKGKAMMWKLDPGAAALLKDYLSNYEGKAYRKEILYYLALDARIKGDEEQFQYYIERFEDEGDDNTERDSEAICSHKYNPDPDPDLVRAELLLNGGYLDSTAHYLDVYKARKQETPLYLYLRSSLQEQTNKKVKARLGYQQLIKMTEREDVPYTSMAWLRLAEMDEAAGKRKDAAESYEACLDAYGSDHYGWIETQARKGLARTSPED